MHAYEVRPRKDRRGFDLISDQLPFGRLWYRDCDAAIGYARFFSRSHALRIIVYDSAGEVLQRYEDQAQFAETVLSRL